MKMKHTLIFTLIIFFMLTLLPDSFAQDASPEYVVRVIYFIPNDTEAAPDIDLVLDTIIKDVQQFYADQMERHGFGRKTFKLETDVNGDAVVHHVNGEFNHQHYHNIGNVIDEIGEHFDISKNIYLVAVDSQDAGYCGLASGRFAFMRVPGYVGDLIQQNGCTRSWVAAHELGHTFGLWHDRRDLSYIMNDIENNYLTTHQSGVEILTPSAPIRIYNQLPKCAAEWLNVHRYFNPNPSAFDAPATIQMLPPSLVEPPATIRLQFEITDPDGLHLAQLLTETSAGYPDNFLDCRKLEDENSVVEFVTSEIVEPTRLSLTVIDVKGNIRSHWFSVDTADLLPPSKAVSIPDANLSAAIRKSLGLTAEQTLTEIDMLRLTRLYGLKDITDLTGLSSAKNLEGLSFGYNCEINDLSPLAGLTRLQTLWIWCGEHVRDISPLEGLTQLQELFIIGGEQIRDISPLRQLTRLKMLWLGDNQIRDISPLANLTRLQSLELDGNHQISDISPLANLTQLVELSCADNQISDVRSLSNLVNLNDLRLQGNPITNRKPLLELLKKNPNVKIYLKHGGAPLPVTLSHFRAEHTEAGVVLKWVTQSEIDNAGFYIYRSETRDGAFKVVTPTMIQGAGTTSERTEYTWTDTTATPNVAYYYQIEDISHAGVRKRLATVRLRGLVSASGKQITQWSRVKANLPVAAR